MNPIQEIGDSIGDTNPLPFKRCLWNSFDSLHGDEVEVGKLDYFGSLKCIYIKVFWEVYYDISFF